MWSKWVTRREIRWFEVDVQERAENGQRSLYGVTLPTEVVEYEAQFARVQFARLRQPGS